MDEYISHLWVYTDLGVHFLPCKIRGGGYKGYKSFLVSKVKRLLVPYLFIALIWAVPVQIYFYGANNIVSKYILCTAPAQLWFLWMLFWVFCLFWPISDIVEKHPFVGMMMVLVFYCIGRLLPIPNYYCIKTALQYMVFFYLGFIIRQYGSKLLYKVPSYAYLMLDVILFAALQYLRDTNGMVFKLVSIGVAFAVHIVGAVASFVILQRIVSRLRDGNVFELLSSYSMAIYLVHQQLIYFPIKWFNGIVQPVVLVVINFAFALAVSVVFAVVMSKTKATRFLLGSK